MKNHRNGFSYNGIDRNKDDSSFFDYSIVKERDVYMEWGDKNLIYANIR